MERLDSHRKIRVTMELKLKQQLRNWAAVWLLLLNILSCTKDSEVPTDVVEELTDDQIAVIDYFKDVALGFEFGSASAITRKWNAPMKVYVGGTPAPELLTELDNIINEITPLITDGFSIEMVSDSLQSNYYVFFGSGAAYADVFPPASNYISNNWGLFFINWNGQNQLNSGSMYVDIERADLNAQKHLLREEFTQSLGLAKDSSQYPLSIFQSAWTSTTTYAPIDRSLIRLLYHPQVTSALNAVEVETVLKAILLSENQ